jgi:hexosaminidase
MPGHSRAAVTVYPQYGNAAQITESGGDASFLGTPVAEDVYNVEPETIRFLQDILDEVMGLFHSSFIHIGGDEVEKESWRRNPRAQERMKELGLKDEDELQSWFIKQMDDYLQSKRRRLLGWDEILEGGLAPGATVMSWRGEAGGIAAAQAGHDVVMSPGTHTYLDHYQSRLRHREPLGIGGYTTVERAYSYEPIPKELTQAQAIHVLGAQFQLWSEWMPHAAHVEFMTYPRGSALAEVFWSPTEGRSFAEFETRLTEHLERLKVMDVNYRPTLPEPEPIGRWKLDAKQKEATFEWEAPTSGAGRYVVAFSTGHRGVPFAVKDVVVSRGAEELGRVDFMEPIDGHFRGCEASVKLPKGGGKVTVKATVTSKSGREIDGEAFLFKESAG